MTTQMLHTCIRVKNLEESMTFYENAIGLKEVRRKDFPDAAFTLVYLAYEEGGFELELTYNYDQPEGYEIGNGHGHLAIGVDDLKISHKQHEEAGHTVTPLKGLPGQEPNYYFITDPDGYKIEVIQNK